MTRISARVAALVYSTVSKCVIGSIDMKQPHKQKLTDAERHKRFLESAKKSEASTNSDDFDMAFKSVTKVQDGASKYPKRA